MLSGVARVEIKAVKKYMEVKIAMQLQNYVALISG